MSRRRRGFGGWISRLEGRNLVLVFIGSAIATGTLVLGGLTGFERRWGIFAANFGFARQVSVAKEIKDLRIEVKQDNKALRDEVKQDNAKILAIAERTQLWQLYDQIKRTQRNIDNLKEKKTLTFVEREQLQDFSNQLTQATQDYQKLVEKVKGVQQ
jgi:hypothetical protein